LKLYMLLKNHKTPNPKIWMGRNAGFNHHNRHADKEPDLMHRSRIGLLGKTDLSKKQTQTDPDCRKHRWPLCAAIGIQGAIQRRIPSHRSTSYEHNRLHIRTKKPLRLQHDRGHHAVLGLRRHSIDQWSSQPDRTDVIRQRQNRGSRVQLRKGAPILL